MMNWLITRPGSAIKAEKQTGNLTGGRWYFIDSDRAGGIMQATGNQQ
jgi:hypothetical protein